MLAVNSTYTCTNPSASGIVENSDPRPPQYIWQELS